MSQQRFIYQKHWKSTFGPRHVQKLRSILNTITKAKNCHVILDMGCGDGTVSQEIKRLLKGSVIGVDISRGCLTKAKERIDGTVLCNLEIGLPFRNCVFDFCALLDVIEHVTDTDRLLSEVHRILKSSGHLVVSSPNLASFFERLTLLLGFQPQNIEVSQYRKFGALKRSPPVGHLKAFTVRALMETLQFHGFRIAEITTTTYLTGIARYIDIALGKISKSLGSLVIFHARRRQ